MIKTFTHKGPGRFFESGSKAGIQPMHAKRLRLILGVLSEAVGPQDLALPGLNLHPLGGDRQGFWSVSVSGNWRVTLRFEDRDVLDVDYLDYH